MKRCPGIKGELCPKCKVVHYETVLVIIKEKPTASIVRIPYATWEEAKEAMGGLLRLAGSDGDGANFHLNSVCLTVPDLIEDSSNPCMYIRSATEVLSESKKKL